MGDLAGSTIPFQILQALSLHNSATVNSVGVNTKKQDKNRKETRHDFADACMILQNKFVLRGMSH